MQKPDLANLSYLCKKTKMADNHDLGREGEARARQFLVNNGYEILETNWRLGHLEIDIIAKQENTLIVVEVKTRRSSYFGEPEIAVDAKKRKLIVKAADKYIRMNGLDVDVRFDIISLVMGGGQCVINHIQDAFYPTLN